MSSRALRRLQDGLGVQGLPCSEPSDEDELAASMAPAPFTGARAKKTAPHLNPFDLVGKFRPSFLTFTLVLEFKV